MATPSLVIVPDRYKAGKLYSQIPVDGTGDFTVTRSTTATRVNASGLIESVASGVPRLDYTGGGCPSLLVEPAATNLLLRSEEFDDASWQKVNSTVTANAGIAPDGTATADALFPNVLLDQHRLDQTPTSTATSQVFSVYAKANGYSFIGMRIGGSAAMFNLSNGATSLVSAGIVASSAFVGNGWYRCVIVKAAGVANEAVRINLSTGVAPTENFLGDVTKSVLLWGAQLETGSVATSYIPTVAATQTRNADVISLSGASALIGQTQGTLYAEIETRITPGVIRTIFGISDGTATNRISLRKTTTDTIQGIALNPTTQASISTTTPASGIVKVAFAYANANFALFVNGVLVGSQLSGVVPLNFSQIDIGKIEGTGTTNQLNDRIRAAAIYTSRLSNAELAQLTTP